MKSYRKELTLPPSDADRLREHHARRRGRGPGERRPGRALPRQPDAHHRVGLRQRRRARPPRRLRALLRGARPARARPPWRHNDTGEDNADAHVKRQLMGREAVVAVTGRAARLRHVGADLLRRVGRAAAEAGPRQDHRGVRAPSSGRALRRPALGLKPERDERVREAPGRGFVHPAASRGSGRAPSPPAPRRGAGRPVGPLDVARRAGRARGAARRGARSARRRRRSRAAPARPSGVGARQEAELVEERLEVVREERLRPVAERATRARRGPRS